MQKKRVFVLVCLMLILVGLVGVASAACPSGMISYYQFEGDASDYMGVHDGTNEGATFVSGQVGQAASVGGLNYINAGFTFGSGSNPISVVSWIKSDGGIGPILSNMCENGNNCGGNTNRGWGTHVRSNVFTAEGWDGGYNEQWFPGTSIVNNNVWHQVIMTRDPTNDVRIYVDGKLESIGNTEGDTWPGQFSLKMGRSGDGHHKFQGVLLLDEVAIFDRALTDGGCSIGADCGGEIGELYDNSKIGYNYCEQPPLCTEDQTIMRLYQPSNSHGALYDYTDYPYAVDYYDIFGFCYEEPEPHLSSCSAPVLWLSDTYNSHASVSKSDYYDTPVCYGDLSCVARDTCEGDEKEVVSLYQDDNSHISFGDDPDYPIKICCTPGAAVTGASWTNMMGDGISNADLNDEVKLMVAGGGLGGIDIQYEIYEECSGLGCISAVIFGDTQVGELDSIGIATWKANQSGNYYFKASLDGGSTWTSSEQNTNGILTVSSTSDNTPAELKIISPNCGINISKDESVIVKVLVNDTDTLWNGTLDFGDGTIIDIKNGINIIPSHQYNDAGTMRIQASVSDNTGGTMTTYLNIMVVDATSGDNYVAACIGKPEAYEVFEQSAIDFDASSSRAIDSSGTELAKSALNFHWTFDDSIKSGLSDYEFTRLFARAGNHLAGLVVEIISLPIYASSAEANFLIAGCSGVDNGISIGQCSASGIVFCAASNTLLETSGSNAFAGACNLSYPNYCCPSGFECREGGGEDGAGNDGVLKCYQRTKDCSDYESSNECEANSCRWIDGMCIEYDASLSCSVYPEKDLCEEDVWRLGKPNGGAGTEICGTIIVEDVTLVPFNSCECAWREDKCKFKYDVAGIYGGLNASKFSCLKFFTAGECLGGQQDLNWTATVDNESIINSPYTGYPNTADLINGKCTSDSIKRNCGQPIVKLPGFTLINIISVLAILAVLYFLAKKYHWFKM